MQTKNKINLFTKTKINFIKRKQNYKHTRKNYNIPPCSFAFLIASRYKTPRPILRPGITGVEIGVALAISTSWVISANLMTCCNKVSNT